MAKKIETDTIAKAVAEAMRLAEVPDGAKIVLEQREFYDIERGADLASQYVTLRNHWVRFTAAFTFSAKGAPRVVLNVPLLKTYVCDTHRKAPAHETLPAEDMCVCDIHENIIVPTAVYHDVPVPKEGSA